jgi:hypothetical protein
LKINEEDDPIESSQITAIPTMQEFIVDVGQYSDDDLPQVQDKVEQS